MFKRVTLVNIFKSDRKCNKSTRKVFSLPTHLGHQHR